MRATNSGIKQADVAKMFGVTQQAISQVISNLRARGTVKTPPRSGRLRKTAEKTDRCILRQAKTDINQTSASINRDLKIIKVFFNYLEIVLKIFQVFTLITQLYGVVYESEVCLVEWL